MPAIDVDRRIDLGAALAHPFPGLRPFEPNESFLFFGREAHTRELLRRLGEHRMLAVVGTSGSGKSSLVRAGLLPALYSGHLAGAGTGWRIAVMRPGSAPLDELAKSLGAVGGEPAAALRARLGSTSLGLVDAARMTVGASRENLLLVVDQFEELFRFRRERETADGGAEASLFVASLLEAVEQLETPVYVAITMRSDFLGDCAQFTGLPEALNQSQYLIPRLTREQRREAIEGPVRVAGAAIAPRLVQRLLNDAGDDPDQLPILQHALMSTFRIWKEEGGPQIDLRHYDKAGGLRDALNRHAQSAYSRLTEASDRALCERIFRCLTTTEAGRAVRRPSRLGRIYGVVGAASETERERVRMVLRLFMEADNSFLVASDPALGDDAVIDISHESLIRKWETLQDWVREEAESASWYQDVLNSVRLRRTAEGGLWGDPELSTALRRKKTDGWNEAWAEQYGAGEWAEAVSFLDASAAKRRRTRLVAMAIVLVLIAAVAAAGWQLRKTRNAQQEARFNRELAALNQKEAAEAKQRLGEIQKAMMDLEKELKRAQSEGQKAALIQKATLRTQAQVKELEAALAKAQRDRDEALRRSGEFNVKQYKTAK